MIGRREIRAALVIALLALAPMSASAVGPSLYNFDLPEAIPGGYLIQTELGANITDGQSYEVNNITIKTGIGDRRVLYVNTTGADVNLSQMVFEMGSGKVSVDLGSIAGIAATHTLYLPANRKTGVYVCPSATSISQLNTGCAGVITYTHDECAAVTQKSSTECGIDSDEYYVSGLTSTGIGLTPSSRWMYYNHSSGSFEVGDNSDAPGYASVAVINGQAVGDLTFAAGSSATALGLSAIALGNESEAGGLNTFAVGYRANASADSSFVIGESVYNPTASSFVVGFSDITLNVTDDLVHVIGDVNATGVVCDGAGNCLDATAFDDSVLWANASNQDTRIITLEGTTGDLWTNASDQDTRIITLESTVSGHTTDITNLWTNASDQDIRIISLETTYGWSFSDASWVLYGSTMSSNLSINSGNVNVTGDLHVYGNIFGGTGADLAERFAILGDAEPGDVMVISSIPQTLEVSGSAYSLDVAGVISTEPAHLMNTDEDGLPLALSGRVPVKVTSENGPIAIGDLLVSSSTPGHAMRCESIKDCYGAVIGKALEPLDGDEGEIMILISLG